MNDSTQKTLSKVPEVTLIFWIIKIAATTLGETGGDAVSMSMNLGYLVGTAIFAAVFLVAVMAQIKAETFKPLLYWATIVATTTVGTTLADFVDRSLGIGYAGGSSLLLTLLLGSLFVWHRTLGTVSVSSVSSPKAEMFYWVTIMFSQTLGTALGIGQPARLDSVTPVGRWCSVRCWQWWWRPISGRMCRVPFCSGLRLF